MNSEATSETKEKEAETVETNMIASQQPVASSEEAKATTTTSPLPVLDFAVCTACIASTDTIVAVAEEDETTSPSQRTRMKKRTLTPDPNRFHHTLHHVHYSTRSPSLRASLLGANDGLLSTASLLMGFAGGSGGDRRTLLLAGISGMIAGALSMACGEYVSVSSQRDSEKADLAREKSEFLRGPEWVAEEMRQLAALYEERGLSPELSRRVVEELHQAAQGDLDKIVSIHARDELAIDADELSNPVSASFLSAVAFIAGAITPIVIVGVMPSGVACLATLVATTSVVLFIFGAIGAVLGGAPWLRAAVRVFIGGCIGMGGTYLVGMAFERLAQAI
ncbi:hypothetical protein HDU96_003387 [Phlyctochytrium bullatum]|nr:hypothetical protein HDU96_003387 [Phlyctochytrium bullatum]